MRSIYLKYSLAAIALFGLTYLSQAQNPIRFQNITVNDGLSMGTITAFEKDYNGFIWIGTAEGLHRYDGQYFKIFKHQENSDNSLKDSYVTCLLSHKKRLYIGNNIGTIDVLNEEDYSFDQINFKNADPKFDNAIEKIVLYKGRLIIDTDGGGLWQYDAELRKLRKMDVRDIGSEEVNDMLVANGKLYLATSTRIVSTDLESSSTVFIDKNLDITCFVKFKLKFFLGTNRGLYSTDLNFGNTLKVPLPPKKRNINGITSLKVQNQDLWIGTGGGLVNYSGRSLSLYKTNQLRPFSLVNDNVNTLFLDSDNILWIGTIAGVSKYAPQLQKFGLLQYFELGEENFNNNVYNTYEDRNGTIWLGTLSSGLIKLDKNREIEAIYSKVVDGPYESSSVRAIYEDTKGNFWVGTGKQGLFLFDRNTGQFRMIACKENGKLKSNTIRNIKEDSKGQLWVALQSGIAVKDSLSNSFTEYRADSEHRNNSIYQIEEDTKTGNLILASFRGGLQIFNPKTKSFKIYVNNGRDSTSLNNNNLMSLAWVGKDSLLIGTYGGGLNIFNLRSGKFDHVTEANGLINNAVYGVIYEGDGSCWLSTNNGVVHYNLFTKRFINFKQEHYLQSTEFNEGAFLKSTDGVFYFGGVNGLNYFKPKELQYDKAAPKIYFTDIRGVFTSRKDAILEMSFLNSRLEIDFMSLNFVNAKGINYEYRLVGFDGDWIASGARNTAIYPRLNPGTYSFEVRAVDEFGNWEVSSTPLKIIVNPPLWQRWWFIALCLLSITGIIVAIFRYRTRQIERLYKLQLVDSELTALRSQMNPHFIFNSLNSIQYFILKKEPREAYTYLSKFASLMRKILQNSRLKYISIADEVEGLNLYLEMEKMRMDNNLDYEITTRNIDDTEHTYIPTMLIQPFAENSIVHGLLGKLENRKLSVLISREKNHLLCTITDNGVGREASRIINEKRSSKHTSAGMSLTQKRLAILSDGRGDYDVVIEDLNFEDGSKGTVVKLVVPVITQID